MSEYKYNNKTYTEQEVSQAADSVGMDFNKYVKSYGIELLQENSSQEPENVSWFDQTWFGRGIAAASTTGEATDLMSQNFSNIDMESIQEFMKAKESEAKSHVPSDRMSKFQEQYVKEGKTWSAFFRGVKDQPGLLPELFVQSLGTQVGTAIDSPGASLGAAATGAGVGAAIAGPLGALTGLMGGLATSMEAALTFGELIETRLKEKNEEFTDENIKALLEAEGTEIRNKAIGRGLTIGAIEGFSGGLAGKAGVAASKVAKGAKRAKVAAGVAGVGVEAVGGATGEVLGRVVAGQEMDAAEIGFEAITGTVTAPLNVSAALLTAKKPTYKLNGASVTYEQMKSFVETADNIDVAKANIQMRNDFTGIGDLATQKQTTAIEAIKRKGDKTEIAEVAKARRDASIQDTIDFAEKSGEFVGKKVSVADDGASTQENYNRIADEIGMSIKDRQDVTEADGFILGDEIVINKDIAGQTGQINVGAHEILHGVLDKHLKSLKTEQKQSFISDFTGIISKESKDYVQNILEERNKDTVDQKNGKTIKGENLDLKTTDEWFAVYSDGITKGDITFNESISVKLRNFLQNIFRKFGYKKEFGSGLDTYNFMRDYQKSIKEGQISKRGIAAAGGGVTRTEGAMSRVYQNVEAMKPQLTSENKQEKSNAAVMAAFELENEVDRRLPITEGISRDEREEIVREFVSDTNRGLIGLLNKYNPEINDSIMGYLNGFVPNTKMSLLDARLQEFYQDNPRFGNIIQSMEQEGVTTKVDVSTTSNPVDVILTQKVLDQFKTPILSGLKFTRKQIKEARELVARIVGTKLPALDAVVKGNKTTTPIIAEMKKQLYSKNGKLHKLVYELMGKDKAALEAFFKNPKYKKAILNSLTTTWLSKYLPMGVQKEVNGIGYTTDHVGRTKGTKDGQINFWRASEEGPYKGMTDGKQKIRRNPNATTDVTSAMLLSAFVKGNTMSDIKRAGLENISLAITQEFGIEVFKADLVNEGPLKKLFEGRQDLFERVLDANYVEEFVRQQERGLAKLSVTPIQQRTRDLAKKIGKETQYDALVLSAALNMTPIDLETREGRQEYMQFIINYVIPNIPRTALQNMSGTFGRGDSSSEKANKNKFLFKNKEEFLDFLDQVEDAGVKFGINLSQKQTNDLNAAGKKEGYGGVSEKTVQQKINNSEFKESKKRGVELFFRIMQDNIQADQNSIPGYALMMSSSSRFQGHIMRTGAIINFWNNLTGKNREEHTSPVTALGKYFFIHAVQGNLFKGRNNIFEKAMKSYFQGSLPIFMDDRLKGVALDGTKYDYSGTPPLELLADILDGKISIWARYFHPNVNNNFKMEVTGVNKKGEVFDRLDLTKAQIKKYSKVGGVDPNVLILEDGNSVAYLFGVDVPVKDQTPEVITAQQDLIYRQAIGETISAAKIQETLNGAKNSKIQGKQLASLSKSTKKVRTVLKYEQEAKGMSVFDFDETLIIEGNNFITATKGDDVVEITSAEWPTLGTDLAEQGYTFNFDDFVNVRGGVEGPLLQKLKNQIGKYGNKNVFVLTARMQASAEAIHGWLKSKGITLPIENITGLGNSTGEAKAMWMLDKFAEGYNDMYFVDDAMTNVEAVKNILDQLDIKSKVVQARLSSSKKLDQDFNAILENKKGVPREKRFSAVAGAKAGFKKGKYRFFVPPSHEDFLGLLYNFIGKGKEGNKHRGFFDKFLIRPLNRAYIELNSSKQVISNDYQALLKAYPEIRKQLTKKVPGTDFTYNDSVRLYLWDKFKMNIPDIDASEITELSNAVKKDPALQAFADKLGLISRQDEGYVKPSDVWDIGDIKTDLADATGRVGRKQFFSEFVENSDAIFSKENLNKIEAIYGKDFREALEDMLYRTINGSARPTGQNRMVNEFVTWLNGSVGATMFLNVRSMLLQQLSNINFINWGDNNVFKAAKAFANQKQYWSDFTELFSSDYLKQRRAGIGFDVNAAELAQTVAKSKEPVRAAIRLLLQKGFTLTQLGDSFAIATGGATMYRNRINTYLKQGYNKKDAKARAFEDFQEVAEATQQSARQDMISQQQASVLGKFILAFQNYGSQVVRIKKRASLDLINRRVTPPYTTQKQSDTANVSKIIHYAVVQNVLFHGLQTALFALMFTSDEDDIEAKKQIDKKKERFIHGMIDTILRGTGIAGGVVSVLKNTAIKWVDNQSKERWKREKNIIFKELLQISPPIGIKQRKIDRGERNYYFDEKAVKSMPLYDIDNPVWPSIFSVVEGATNVPLHNTYQNIMNIRHATDSELETWKRLHLVGGWSNWDVGVKNEEVEAAKKSTQQINKKGSQTQPAWLLKNKSSSKSSSKNKKAKKPVGFLP